MRSVSISWKPRATASFWCRRTARRRAAAAGARQHQAGDERRPDLQESLRYPALTGDVPMLQHAALSLEDAKRVAAAARAEAEKNGWAIVIAVVDDGGHLMYLERMDGAQKASSRIAEAKGRTAILFQRPTKAIEDNVLEGGTGMIG